MGCDIHLMIEVKTNGKWKALSGEKVDFLNNFDNRNYELFGILSGVRREAPNGKPLMISGIPEDASKKVKDLLEDGDAHSHGYATIDLIDAYPWNEMYWDREGTLPLREYLTNPEKYRLFEPRGTNKNHEFLGPEEVKPFQKAWVLSGGKDELVKGKLVTAQIGQTPGDSGFQNITSYMKQLGTNDTVRLIVYYDN